MKLISPNKTRMRPIIGAALLCTLPFVVLGRQVEAQPHGAAPTEQNEGGCVTSLKKQMDPLRKNSQGAASGCASNAETESRDDTRPTRSPDHPLAALFASLQQDPTNTALLNQLKSVAQSGDAEAQYQLGKAHENGHVTSDGEDNAIKWYTLAAKGGNIPAMMAIGGMYLRGSGGLPRKPGMAFVSYMDAANAGDLDAAVIVGDFYFRGYGTSRNQQMAEYWWKRAARQGNPQAKANLTNLYRRDR